MSKRLVVVLVAIGMIVSGRLIWKHFATPLGDQRVHFTPARAEHFVSGDLEYTVYRAARGVNGDILYQLHGRNLDTSIWNDDTYYTAQIQAYWQAYSMLPPTVVVVSYGPVWLLTPKNSRSSSGLLDNLVAKLPEIEAKTGHPRRRILLGESMGGLNVLILGLSHPLMFSKIASLCPGVYLDSPFSDFRSQRAALKRTGADPGIMFGITRLAKRYVSDEEEWNAINPLALMRRATPQYPELYLSCGLYDRYGNYEGTEALAELAAKKGVRTTWHPMYGGHCAVDVASVSTFLTSH